MSLKSKFKVEDKNEIVFVIKMASSVATHSTDGSDWFEWELKA